MKYLALVVTCAAACSRTPAPKDPTEYALFRDLERDVTVAAATGWNIDRIEIDKLLGAAMDSVCRVDVLGRRGLAQWVDEQIRAHGGPVEQAWRDHGKKLGKVGDLLVLTRVQKLLARADEISVDCPFWVEPENPFTGRQISEHTWQLSLSGIGNASAMYQGGKQDINAGGSGRLLIGRTFAGGDALYIGIDAGASAQFPKDKNGMRTSLEIGADLVAPIVYRRTLTNTYFELEGGWFGHSTEQNWGAVDNGIHLGIAFGGRALRQRFLFPGAALGIAYERLFVAGDDLTLIKIGARVAFDLDL